MSVEVTAPPTATAAPRALFGAVAVAAVAGLGLHLAARVDGAHHVLSTVAATAGGAVLLGVGCAALVAAAVLLAGAVRDVPRRPVIRVLLGVWAAGLVAVGAFPAAVPGAAATPVGIVHVAGAVLVISVPPVVGLLVDRRGPLRAVSTLTAGVAALYGAAHLPTILAGVAPLPFVGLLQRVLLALVLVVVVLTGAALGARR